MAPSAVARVLLCVPDGTARKNTRPLHGRANAGADWARPDPPATTPALGWAGVAMRKPKAESGPRCTGWLPVSSSTWGGAGAGALGPGGYMKNFARARERAREIFLTLPWVPPPNRTGRTGQNQTEPAEPEPANPKPNRTEPNWTDPVPCYYKLIFFAKLWSTGVLQETSEGGGIINIFIIIFTHVFNNILRIA